MICSRCGRPLPNGDTPFGADPAYMSDAQRHVMLCSGGKMFLEDNGQVVTATPRHKERYAKHRRLYGWSDRNRDLDVLKETGLDAAGMADVHNVEGELL